MKRILLTLCLLTLPSIASAEPKKYTFDKEHTTILFFIDHLGFSQKIGLMRDYDGYFIFDKEKPEQSYVKVTFKPSGIDTGSKELDKHLQDDKWFNAAKYPDITFESFKIDVTGKDTADIKGWLTMMGVKKRVTLHTKFNKDGTYPMTEIQAAGFSADTEFKRSLFGLNNGIPFVSDDVKVHIETEGHLEKK